jgi:hypothetical protein
MSALIRGTHPYAFRPGEWAAVTGIITWPPTPAGRRCWTVEFDDGVTDFWLIDEPPGQLGTYGYEFLMVPAGTRPGIAAG